MNLLPLINRLQAAGLGTPGDSLFVNMMPPQCEKGTLLRQPLTGTAIDYYLPEYFKTRVQVIVRTHDFEEGQELIKQVVNALTIKTPTQLDAMFVRYLRPVTKPVSFPMTLGNFIEFTVPMDICYNGGDE